MRRSSPASSLRPLVLLLCLPACHTWTPRDVPSGPAPAVAPVALSGGHPVRVTRADGSRIELAHARVAGDSVVGETGAPLRHAAVALADVRRVEERRVSGRRTSLLVGGVAAGTLVLLGFALAAGAGLGDWQ